METQRISAPWRAPSGLIVVPLQLQANTHLLSVTIDEFHTSGITQFVFLSVWLPRLSIMTLRCVHVVCIGK